MNQPDQDRLREEVWQVFQDLDIRVDEGQGYLYDTTEAVERIQALIAREVRLVRYDELTKVKVYDDPADTIAYIRNRERELEKEPPMSEPTPRENLKPSISGELEIKGRVLRPLADKFGELAREIDAGKYPNISTIEEAQTVTENYIDQAWERLEQLMNAEVLAVLDELEDEVNEFGFMRFDGAITQLKQRYGGKE